MNEITAILRYNYKKSQEDTIYKHEGILLSWKGYSYVNAHAQRVASCAELGIHNSQDTYRNKIQCKDQPEK